MVRLSSLCLLFTVLLPAYAVAGSYCPGVPVSLKTEFRDSSKQSTETLLWTVRASGGAGGCTATFSLVEKSRETPFGSIVADAQAGTRSVRLPRSSSAVLDNQTAYLNPGLPAPMDVLPCPEENGQSLAFSLTRSAGGMTFKDSYSVARQAVSLDSIRAQGLQTDPEILAYLSELKDPELYLLTASKTDTAETVSRQLWLEGMDWWLYESTHFRTSWLLPTAAETAR